MFEGRIYQIKIVVFHILLMLNSMNTFSQDNTPRLFQKAELYYAKKDYINAIELYSFFISKGSRSSLYLKWKAESRLAYSYYFINENKKAEELLEKLSGSGRLVEDSTSFIYAMVLKKNQKYDRAKVILDKLSKIDSARYFQYKVSCDSAIAWNTLNDSYIVENLNEVNTAYSEVSPYGYKNGFVFSSNKEDVIIRRKSKGEAQPYYNIYSAKCDSSRGCSIKNFSNVINTTGHELSPSFNREQSKVYFTRSSVTNSGRSRLKLFCSENINGNWRNSEKFIFNDSTYSFAHCSIDGDERMFFFSSDMPGGYGGTDIYVCFNFEGKWSNPVNLGPVINTKGNESYPFYHSSSETLYFSSDYHPGLGGYDLFMAQQKDGDWEVIINLKSPINSSSDDFSMYFSDDKTMGYLTSNRPGGKGREDIYVIKKK